MNRHHETAMVDRLPWSQKISYGLGGIVPIALFNIVGMLMGLIGNVGLGISALLLGVVQMVPRVWDAFTDPMMGYVSDNTRCRFGRRRPYILFGGIAVCVTFVAMWWIPKGDGATVAAQLAFILILLILFYTAVTAFEIPHGALGLEMTADYHERTRLFSAKSFIGNVGAIATPFLYKLSQMDCFKGAGGNETEGMRYVSIIVALIALPCVVICALVCKEPKFEQVQNQKRVSLKENLGVTFKNRTFLILVGIVFMVIMGFNFVANFANYITIFYLYGGGKVEASDLMAYTGVVWAVTSLIAIPPMNWLSSKMGKTVAMLTSISLMGGAQLTKIICYNPDHPYLIMIPTAMLSAGMVMYFTMASSLLADVCDEDELNTGNRNEGAYYSVFWWFMKMGMAFAGIVAGALLLTSDFDDQQSMMLDAATGPIREVVAGLEEGSHGLEQAVVNEKIGVSIEKLDALTAHFVARQKDVSADHDHYAGLIARAGLVREQLLLIPSDKEFVPGDTAEKASAVIEQARALAHHSPRTLLRLRIFEICIPLLLCIISFIAMRFYPLSEDRVYEIKKLLEKRNAKRAG